MKTNALNSYIVYTIPIENVKEFVTAFLKTIDKMCYNKLFIKPFKETC